MTKSSVLARLSYMPINTPLSPAPRIPTVAAVLSLIIASNKHDLCEANHNT